MGAYVYDTRSDLNGSLLPFVLEADKDAFYSQLNEAEDWLYGEGGQATKQAYQEKLAQLKKVGEPIRIRRREAEDRDDAVEKLRQALENYRLLAQSTDPKYEHIPQEERQKVLNKVKEAEDSVLPKAEQQKTLPSTADPIIWVADITHTKENLDTFVSTIMNKPKPKAAAPAGPKEEPKKEETAEPTEKKEADMDVEQ